jgi:hypothetical protein
MPVTFVRIVNPKVPGGTLVLAWADFDPTVHTLFVEADPPASAERPHTVLPTVTSGTVTVPAADVAEDIARTAEALSTALTPAKPTRVRKPKPASLTPADPAAA